MTTKYSATPNDIVSLLDLTMHPKEASKMEDMTTFYYDNAGRSGVKLKYKAINISYNDYCQTNEKSGKRFFSQLTLQELHKVISRRLKRYMKMHGINFIAFPEIGGETLRYHMHGIAIFLNDMQIHDYKVWLRNTFLTNSQFINYQAVKACDDPDHWFGYISK